MTALLITGSRSLSTRGQSIRRSRILVAWSILSLSPTVVVFGDAVGPDEYARDVCHLLRIPYRLWALSGWIDDGNASRPWVKDGDDPEHTSRWPLIRDERMVAAVAHHYPGANCVALVDPCSTTHGTEHTAWLAQRAGLRVIWCAYGDVT